MPPVKSIFISIVLLTFVLPFVGAVGHAYELLDWDGYGYFFKLSAALFLCLWGVLLCRNGLVLTAKAPRYAIRTSTVIAAVAIIALFGAFPFCLCLHMFCVLGLLVLAAILRHTIIFRAGIIACILPSAL